MFLGAKQLCFSGKQKWVSLINFPKIKILVSTIRGYRVGFKSDSSYRPQF